jgi:hypothetical protein
VGGGGFAVYARGKQQLIGKREDSGLVLHTPEDTVFAPFESLEIYLTLFKKAA